MNLTQQGYAVKAADLFFLTVLMLMATLGYISAMLAAQFSIKTAVLGMYILVLIVWVANWSNDRKSRSADVEYALWILAQAALQVIISVYGTVAAGITVVLIMSKLDQKLDWLAHVTSDKLMYLNSAGFTACLVTALMLSAWRLHDLRKRGLKLHELKSGTLNSLAIEIPATEERVNTRLNYYLGTLNMGKVPGLSRLIYGKKPTVLQMLVNGLTVYTTTWRDCPSKICITVGAKSKSSTSLHMSCELRPGFHKLNLFVNPHDALALMTYMQAHVIHLLASELSLSNATARQDELRHHALEMQLRILQAQIEPHFLFNTLASVRHLYRSSTDAGELMMDHVITYLRCTMQELRSDLSTVGKEMDLVLHYLAIMKIRMGERLSYSFIQSDEVAERAFPPAMLISLVENAIKHGLNDRADGKLTISAAREEQYLRVTVLDNGPGFSNVQGTGVGLSNIRQRLETIYGNRAWLEVGALAKGGFVASIVVPYPDNDTAEAKDPA